MRFVLIVFVALLCSACKGGLKVAVTGNGEVVSVPPGIHCGNGNTKCEFNFGSASNIKLIANPKYFEYFKSWSGACAGNANCIVASPNGATASAAFTGHSNIIQARDRDPNNLDVLPISSSSLISSGPDSATVRWRDPDDGIEQPVINGTPYSKTYEIYASSDDGALFSPSSRVASLTNSSLDIHLEGNVNDNRCANRPPFQVTRERKFTKAAYFDPYSSKCYSTTAYNGAANFVHETHTNPGAAERALALCQSTCNAVKNPHRLYEVKNLLGHTNYYFGMVLIDRFGKRSANIRLGTVATGGGLNVKSNITINDATAADFISQEFTGVGVNLRRVMRSSADLGDIGEYIAIKDENKYLLVYSIVGKTNANGVYTLLTIPVQPEDWLDGSLVIRGSGYPLQHGSVRDVMKLESRQYQAKTRSSSSAQCEKSGSITIVREDDPDWDITPSFNYCVPLIGGNNYDGCDNDEFYAHYLGNFRKKIGFKFDFSRNRCLSNKIDLYSTDPQRVSLIPIKYANKNWLARLAGADVSVGIQLAAEAQSAGSAKADMDFELNINNIGFIVNGPTLSSPRGRIDHFTPTIKVIPSTTAQMDGEFSYKLSVIPKIKITKDLLVTEGVLETKRVYNILGTVKAQQASKITNAGLGFTNFTINTSDDCSVELAEDGIGEILTDAFNIDLAFEVDKCKKMREKPPTNHFQLPGRIGLAFDGTDRAFSYSVSQGNGFMLDSGSILIGAHLSDGRNLARYNSATPGQLYVDESQMRFSVPADAAWKSLFESATRQAGTYQFYELAHTQIIDSDGVLTGPALPIVLAPESPVVNVVPPTPPISCGTVLSRKGYFSSSPQTYEMLMGETSGRVEWEFEAYYLPDRLTIRSKKTNERIYRTGDFVQGGYSNSFEFNPAIHGTILEVVIETREPSTVWTYAMSCPGQPLTNSNRQEVPISLSVNIGATQSGLSQQCKLDFWFNGRNVYSSAGRKNHHSFNISAVPGANDGIAAYRYAVTDCSSCGYGGCPVSWDQKQVSYGNEIFRLPSNHEGTIQMDALR